MSKKLKQIGIPGYSVGENTFGVGKKYLTFIAEFGKPVILTHHNYETEDIDLLLLPGGKDITPHRYGEFPSYQTQESNLILEAFDTLILPKYIENDTAIVGICRGMQSLYCHFQGKLIQHIVNHPTSAYETHEVHPIVTMSEFDHICKDENGNSLIKGDVNSRHHQMCDVEYKPEEIDIIGYTGIYNKKEDKTYYYKNQPEIIMHKTKNIFAVQWHPKQFGAC